MTQRPSLRIGTSAAAVFVLLCSCSAAAPASVSSTQSALSGTVEPTAAGDCATTYVNCVRVGGTTCRDDLVSCIGAATTTTSASDSGASSDGDGGHKRGHGGGNCKADGTIDPAGVDACLATLETCAASSSTALETCVSDAVTCVSTSN